MMALVAALSAEQAKAVYSVVSPLLLDGRHAIVQKRAYKVRDVAVVAPVHCEQSAPSP